METLEKVSRFLDRISVYVAGIVLSVMIILTCANIFLRIVWLPIGGTFELMGYMGAVAAALVLGRTQSAGGHISVNVLIDVFPQKVKNRLKVINSSIMLLFFAVITWQIFKIALNLQETGEVSETLRIVFYPFTHFVALGSAFLTFTLLVDLIKALSSKREELT